MLSSTYFDRWRCDLRQTCHNCKLHTTMLTIAIEQSKLMLRVSSYEYVAIEEQVDVLNEYERASV